jgi:DNA replication protein DnaC
MEAGCSVLLLTLKSMLLRLRHRASVGRRARRPKVGRLKGRLQELGLPEVLILDEIGRQPRLSRALADSTVDTKAVPVRPNPL